MKKKLQLISLFISLVMLLGALTTAVVSAVSIDYGSDHPWKSWGYVYTRGWTHTVGYESSAICTTTWLKEWESTQWVDREEQTVVDGPTSFVEAYTPRFYHPFGGEFATKTRHWYYDEYNVFQERISWTQ